MFYHVCVSHPFLDGFKGLNEPRWAENQVRVSCDLHDASTQSSFFIFLMSCDISFLIIINMLQGSGKLIRFKAQITSMVGKKNWYW